MHPVYIYANIYWEFTEEIKKIKTSYQYHLTLKILICTFQAIVYLLLQILWCTNIFKYLKDELIQIEHCIILSKKKKFKLFQKIFLIEIYFLPKEYHLKSTFF